MTGWDRLAPFYRTLETVSFGPLLHRARLAWIDQLSGRQRILLLGDGNGRFLAAALEVAPDARFTVIDGSEGMIAAAKKRIGGEAARVDFIHAQIPDQLALLNENGENPRFDAVTAHFFFDCFSSEDVAAIVDRITAHTTPDAVWLVSEFHVPSRPAWKHLIAGSIVRSLYLAFGIMTGIKARSLPDWERIMDETGWRRSNVKKERPVLLKADLWKRNELRSDPA